MSEIPKAMRACLPRSSNNIAFEAHDAADFLQIAGGGFELRDGIQSNLAGCLVAFFHRNLVIISGQPPWQNKSAPR
jgi:hypothetical protein